MDAMTAFNVLAAALESGDGPAPFASRDADIGTAIGGERLGGSVIEIPPGARAFPYHWEAAQEEWLLVLAGTVIVRTPGGEEELGAGDLVCFPVGPEGAHAMRNAAHEPCRIVMLSNRAPVNAVVYPDSDKVGLRTPWLRSNFRASDAVEYWSGE